MGKGRVEGLKLPQFCPDNLNSPHSFEQLPTPLVGNISQVLVT